GHSDLAWVPYATFLHSWLGVAMPYLLEQDLRAFAIATRHTSRWRVLDDRVVILDRARQLDPSPAWLQEHLPGALDLQFGGNETELVVWGTLAVDPDKIWQPRPKDIIDEPNLFLRQLMLERFGTKKFFAAIGARQIAKDATGTLYRIDAHTESLVVVRVTNSTMEPDGSFKEYFLRVPPSMTSAQQAVAWTFGLEEHEYAPVVET
ncbi:MAG: hypothetical protein KJO07_08160, partial [Deltaproteobacteria bacterium]|nr:hypothetical protein [Deltaproteobacteria bacterium]